MLSPRWRKVLRDVGSNKTRTVLVVVSIAVGIFAVGLILSVRVMLMRAMQQAIADARPPSATFHPAKPFGDDLVQIVRRMRGVGEAEGLRNFTVRFKAGEEWRELQLTAYRDYDDIRINTLKSVSGVWPPRENDLLIERASLAYLDANVGDTVVVDVGDGKQRPLRIAGVAYNPYAPSSAIDDVGYGFVSLDTWEKFAGERTFNQLRIIVAEHPDDINHIRQIAKQVRAKLEKGGNQVLGMDIGNLGQHPAEEALEPVLLILGAVGAFSLILSGLLVTNTLGALLIQQTRQIGVMKAIGARSAQIVGMYLAAALLYGVLALLVAAPLGAAGAFVLANFLGRLLNLDITSTAIPLPVFALEAMLALLVPLLAALVPVIAGARITVHQALSGYGLGAGQYGQSLIDRLVERVSGRFPAVSRPTLLSLRNTFRRKGRLLLTLMTLMAAGAIFITVFTTRASLLATFDDAVKYWNYDLELNLSRPYLAEMMEHEVLRVPGVAEVESWGFMATRRVRADGSESEHVSLFAPPAQTTMLQPTVVQGRWLLPADEQAVVINTDLLKTEPGLEVGTDLVLTIEGKPTTWRVVGIARSVLTGPAVYANYPSFGRVVGEVGRTTTMRVVTARHDAASQLEVAKAIDAHFKAIGIRGGAGRTSSSLRAGFESMVNLLVGVLLVMALLLAVVGGLGLTGTMSINVLERTREIGVMRAIGASNAAIRQIVIAEGVLTGALGWLLGFALALPLGKLLNHAVGMGLLQAPLSYTFSIGGTVIWLGLTVVISAVASILPAWNASRVTVREALAYE